MGIRLELVAGGVWRRPTAQGGAVRVDCGCWHLWRREHQAVPAAAGHLASQVCSDSPGRMLEAQVMGKGGKLRGALLGLEKAAEARADLAHHLFFGLHHRDGATSMPTCRCGSFNPPYLPCL